MHGADRIQHRLIHIDIDDLGAVFNLLTGDRERVVVFLVQNHPCECFGACYVSPFADIDE